MYKSENAFSKVLSLKLKLLGYSVIRIETGLTCQGVPDMFVQGNGTDFWLELKNEKKLTLETTKLKVHWRPGQQPWAYTYYMQHHKNKYTFTVIAGDNCFVLVCMKKVFTDNVVMFNDECVFKCKSLTELMETLFKEVNNAK